MKHREKLLQELDQLLDAALQRSRMFAVAYTICAGALSAEAAANDDAFQAQLRYTPRAKRSVYLTAVAKIWQKTSKSRVAERIRSLAPWLLGCGKSGPALPRLFPALPMCHINQPLTLTPPCHTPIRS